MRADTISSIFNALTVRAPLILFVLNLSANAGDLDDPFGEHTYPETIHTANLLSSIEPATTWEIALEGEASDLLEFVSSDLLLAGVVVVDRNSAPDFGPVYLVDTSTGEVKWEYERDDLSGGSYSLLLADPMIILLGVDQSSARIIALDPESGRELWDEKFDTPFGLVRVPGGNQLIVAYRDGSDFESRVLDLATGDTVMEVDLPSQVFSDVSHIPVTIDDGSALIVGRSVVKVDLAQGSVVRTTDIPISDPDPVSTMFLAEGMLAWDEDEIAYLDPALDETHWTVSSGDGPILTVAVSGGSILISSGAGQSWIDLLDPATGLTVWSTAIDGRIVSPIATSGDLLLCTTDSTAVGIRAADGATAFILHLPSDMASGSPSFAEIMGLPDVLRVEEGVLFVARERAGIAALDLPDGTLRWYHAHYNANLPLINYTADGRFASVYATMIEMGQLSLEESFLPPPSLSSVNPEGSSQLLAVAQQRHDHARARNESGQGDALDVEIASTGEIVALQMDIFSGQMIAGLEVAQSILNFGAALRELQRAQGRQGAVDRMEYALQGAQRAQECLFQSGYYLRPFYMEMWGRGVTIVETATGNRRDIIFSPQSPPALAYGLDMPTFAVDPQGNQMAVFGISLQTDTYQRRSKWGTHIPNYSLLNYSLAQLDFYSHPTVYPALEPAIMSGDIEQIEWLVDKGRDSGILEWRNWNGETPIFIAAVLGMTDVVELLINAGADVNAICDMGMTTVELGGLTLSTFDVLLAAGARTASGEIPERTESTVPPMLMAVASCQPDEIRRLVEGGEDVNWRFENGDTYLSLAAIIGNPEIVRLLLECGAEVNLVNTDGQTAYDLAATDEIRDILQAAGGRSGSE